MRFVLHHGKSGRLSAKQVKEIEKRIAIDYPSLEDVVFRSKGKVFVLKKRKQPYYKQKQRDPRDGRLKKMRRPPVTYVPKRFRSDTGYITAVPVKKSGIVTRFREKHGFTRSRSSVIERYYYESLYDVKNVESYAASVAKNIVKDFKKFRSPEQFVARLIFLVRGIDRDSGAAISFLFPRSTFLMDYMVFTYDYIYDFVFRALLEADQLLHQRSGKTRIQDVILEKHEVRNEIAVPMMIRNI